MKIKKIFGLVSICSLAVLMTACGSSSKNDGILDKDYISLNAVTKNEYIDENKADKEVELVFSDKKIMNNYSYLNGGIVTAYDDDKYYVYNLNLGGKQIFEGNITDIANIRVNVTHGNYLANIRVKYNQTEAGYTRCAIYLPDGNCISDTSEETYQEPDVSVAQNSSISMSILGQNDSYIKFLLKTYTKDGEETKTVNTYYYAVKKFNSKIYEYISEEEFINRYKDYKDRMYDGEPIGLKGYTVQSLNDHYNIYKKGTIVNIINVPDDSIISNGYYLFQSYKEVSVNDKYDIFYGGKYLQVNTFKTSLLTSKTTKVNDFHYYFKNIADPLVSKDEDGNYKEIKGYVCQVFDFKEKKSVTDKDLKIALVKGNGNIEVNKSLLQSNTNTVISDGDNYYSYSTNTTTSTVVNDKNGKVINVYDGTYYDGILVKSDDNANTTFYDKNGNKVLYLKNAVKYSLNKYVGTDLFGNSLVACIDKGEIKTADLKDYQIATSKFLTKADSDTHMVSFYSFDNTLSEIFIQYDYTKLDMDEYISIADYDYYSLYDSAANTYTVFYFK